MERDEKEVVWLKGEVKSPPFSREARIEAGAFPSFRGEAMRAYVRIFSTRFVSRSSGPILFFVPNAPSMVL